MPDKFLQAVSAIYSERKFIVTEGGHVSDIHDQKFGISQGCPLSPFLFVIVMTVLLHDAKRMLEIDQNISLSNQLTCHELLYADDTLLIEVDKRKLEAYMHCIVQCGQKYRFQLNWGEVEQININCEDMLIHQPDGSCI